jgi:hypothetical protein
LINESTSEQTERIFREVFENRSGWIVTKLDSIKQRAADFRVFAKGVGFLCEIKTIRSSHSNFAYKPIDYYEEERERSRKLIERSQVEDPQRNIVMPPGQYDFTFGDPIKFRVKYNSLPRNTEKYFNEFVERLVEYLTTSSRVRNLPYMVRLDSDDLYIPYEATERQIFFQWLEDEIDAISKGRISWFWHDNNLPYTESFYTFKEMKTYGSEGELKSVYQINIERLHGNVALQVQVHSYGVLNEPAIIQEIEGAISQLQASAKRETDKAIPRIIVLAFESGLSFEENQLFRLITEQLKIHTNVSAIAVINWVPEKIYIHRDDEDILTWIKASFNTKHIPGFFVVHNPWLDARVKHLETNVFDMIGSVQFSPIQDITPG